MLFLKTDHEIIKTDDKNFTFNLKEKPLRTTKIYFKSWCKYNHIQYNISFCKRTIFNSTKINFPGKGYTILPRVIGFASTQGKDGIVKVSSPDIGQIDTLLKELKMDLTILLILHYYHSYLFLQLLISVVLQG